MKQEKSLEYGDVQYNIDIRVEYSIWTNEEAVKTESKVVKTVSLDVGAFSRGDGLSIEKIFLFQRGANELLRLTKELLMDGTYVTLTLSKSAYEHVPAYTVVDALGTHESTLRSLEFLSWTFADSTLDDPEEEGAGLYLQPDTKGSDVEPHWDGMLYWKKDILESLAEMHL